MKYIIVLLFFLQISIKGISQTIYFKEPIHIDLIHQYLYSLDKKDSSISTNLSSTQSQNFKIISYNNRIIKFVYLDTVKKLTVKGQYLINNEIIKNPRQPIKEGKKATSFGPAYFKESYRDGSWIYLNILNKKLLFKELYKNGKKIQ